MRKGEAMAKMIKRYRVVDADAFERLIGEFDYEIGGCGDPEYERDRLVNLVMSSEGQTVEICDGELRSWWIGWKHPDTRGQFALCSPWWESGCGYGYKTICAAVRARDMTHARDIVYEAYDERPDHIDFRFVEERTSAWSPFSERFQRADWMKWGDDS